MILPLALPDPSGVKAGTGGLLTSGSFFRLLRLAPNTSLGIYGDPKDQWFRKVIAPVDRHSSSANFQTAHRYLERGHSRNI